MSTEDFLWNLYVAGKSYRSSANTSPFAPKEFTCFNT